MKKALPQHSFEFWKTYEEKVGTSSQKEHLRVYAIEWFRCESYKRAMAAIYPELESLNFIQFIQELNKYDELIGLHDRYRQLEEILKGQHHWLIGQGEKPIGWLFPYYTPSLKRQIAVQIVETPRKSSPERLVVEINPNLPIDGILKKVKTLVQKAQKRKRASGGGKDQSLLRLWAALHTYDERQKGTKLVVIGREYRDFLKLDHEKEKADDVAASKLLALAKKMLSTAKDHPQAWLDTFL